MGSSMFWYLGLATSLVAVVFAEQSSAHVHTPNRKPRVVAWYFGKYPKYPPEDIDFSQPGGVTHLLFMGLPLETDKTKLTFGTVNTCNRSKWSDVYQRAYNLAKKAGAKVQFMFPTDDPGKDLLAQLSIENTTARNNFMSSLKQGLDSCQMDGFEVDWEGPSSQQQSDGFLQMLIEARHKLGSNKYALSFDTEPPQWLPGDYFKPTVSIWSDKDTFGKVGGGNDDPKAAELFVNFMTYFQTADSKNIDNMIGYYETSMDSAISQNYPLDVVTIGVPYYMQTEGQNEWSIECSACKDLAYSENMCSSEPGKGFNIVGKQANFEIGKRIAKLGLGGVFPWVLDYDVSPKDLTTCGDNNLFQWLKKGLATGADGAAVEESEMMHI